MKKIVFVLSVICLTGLIGWRAVAATGQNPIDFGLKISPTSVEATLDKGQDKKGFIDISNPDDVSKTVTTSVSAFKQVNNNGDLEFYDNPDLNKAILLDLSDFTLGPHEAIRMYYLIKPQNLPPGGTYGTIFFTAHPVIETNNPKNINISTRVGTLLILTNGDGQKEAELSATHVPFWQFGNGIKGDIEVKNTANSKTAVAFHPDVKTHISPWGKTSEINSPLVFPGISRQVVVDKSGSYVGLIPYTIIVQGKKHIIWVLAVTGYWRFLLPCIIIVLIIAAVYWYLRRKK